MMGIKNIWDGKDLPPVGSHVLINLASCGMREYEVSGYQVKKSVIEEHRHKGIFVVNILVKSLDGKATNCRFLDEVFPLDWREGANQ
ncbi:hypothetical protein ACTZM0_27990 [Klebsiella pneumoniae]|uniref:hypothetical protein n=2 Tax=Klebsiella michiganensis TaxID=1134687 RepID=UPI0012B8663F|nr:hypothetical protein [Klebsiella michiganensis]HBM3164571.1 hypothetical protein [Klebsiella michiganensis]